MKYIIKYILQIRNHNWINIFNDILIQAMVSDFCFKKYRTFVILNYDTVYAQYVKVKFRCTVDFN